MAGLNRNAAAAAAVAAHTRKFQIYLLPQDNPLRLASARAATGNIQIVRQVILAGTRILTAPVARALRYVQRVVAGDPLHGPAAVVQGTADRVVRQVVP